MTLAEIADLVCEKVGKTDDASQALAKKFVNRRYVMIHDSELWQDSLATIRLVTQFNWLTFPYSVDRVLAIRSGPDASTVVYETQLDGTQSTLLAGGSTNLSPNAIGQLFQTDPAAFETIGTPTQFVPLSPVGLDWSAISMSNIPSPGQAVPFPTLISVAGSNTADTGKKVVIEFDPASYFAYDRNSIYTALGSETLILNGTLVVTQTNTPITPRAVSKEATVGYVTLTTLPSSFPYQIYLPPESCRIEHCRVQIIPAPQQLTGYTCLVKRRARQMTKDQDTPGLRGCDDALIAFVQADMLERFRQYSKAQLKQAEGVAQLAKMRDMERNQQANSCRIIPIVDSYEDQYETSTL